MVRLPVVLSVVAWSACQGGSGSGGAAAPDAGGIDPAEVRAAIDAYLDRRFAAVAGDTAELVALIERADLDVDAVEEMLRAGRASYGPPPQPPGELSLAPLSCDHVDYA